MATQSTKKTALEKLKAYIKKTPYVSPLEQIRICSEFNLPYKKNAFRSVYRNRFYLYLFNNTTTNATVSKETGIPHKYLCECKAYYEKRSLLKVVGLGKCPTTGTTRVQYLSTNPKEWDNKDVLKENQLNLF